MPFLLYLFNVLAREIRQRNKRYNNWKGINKSVIIYRKYNCLDENSKKTYR